MSLHDAMFIACVKGLVAGFASIALALAYGARMPAVTATLQAGLLGFVSYGLSLALFVVALRRLGTARTGAYFSLAPFVGAALAVVLGAPLTATLVVAGLLMAAGVWLHLTERHEHLHHHLPVEHAHLHTHDAHHQHRAADPPRERASATGDHELTALHPHTAEVPRRLTRREQASVDG